MKTRMKKLISIKSIPILALALLVVLGSALAAGRDPVSGSGEVFLGTTLTGPVSLVIGGKEWDGQIEVITLGKVVELESGVTHYYGVVHKFKDSSENNTFTTIGDEISAPTGDELVYTLGGYMEITEGTGMFERAEGRLSVRGEFNLYTFSVPFKVNGAMSL